MKKLLLIFSALLLVIISAISQQERQPASAEKELLGSLNSCGSVLYALARERFAAHEAKNETWILTFHVSPDWASLEKYTDGNYVIASIPVLHFEADGMSLYVSQYNALTTRKGDLLAVNGKYQEALKIYRLLQRFDKSENTMSERLGERIACVEKLLNKQESEKQLKRLKELTTNFGECALEMLETRQAVVRTNLLELSFGKGGYTLPP